MGKRKTKKPPPKKKQPKVDTVFDCPFCNHEKVVECKMDKGRELAFVRCRICSAEYQTYMNALTEAIDVYYEWIDKCAEVNADD